MEFGDIAAISTLVPLLGYVLWFISRSDSRLFKLADRQSEQINQLESRIRELQGRLDDEEELTDRLRRNQDNLSTRLGTYIQGTRILVQQIRQLGQEPFWEPPTES